VLTGADAEALSPARTAPNPGGPAVDVVYPDIADSGKIASPYRDAFAGPRADISASWAIVTYDAVTAAEKAAQQAGQGSSAPPLPGAVACALAGAGGEAGGGAAASGIASSAAPASRIPSKGRVHMLGSSIQIVSFTAEPT